MIERPFDLVLHLTHGCSLRCRYCYGGRAGGRSMSLETACRALRIGAELSRGFPRLEIGFFGGEPLLRFDLMRQIVRLARSMPDLRGHPVQFNVTTNGTLITDERAAWLANHKFAVAVSIDGDAPSHDAHRVFADGLPTHSFVVDGIRMLQRRECDVRAALTVTPDTAPQLVRDLDYLRQIGIRDIEVTPDYDRSVWDSSRRQALRSQLQAAADFYTDHFDELAISFLDEKVCALFDPNGAWPCGFGWAKLAVSPAGNLYGCERMIHEDNDWTWRVGDARGGLNVTELRSLAAMARARDHRCRRCQVERPCQHDCACVNLARTGDIGRPDDFVCFYERACLEAAARFGSRLSAVQPSAQPAPAIAV